MIAIVDSGGANLKSVLIALKRLSKVEVQITSSPEVVLGADRVILPGVGTAGGCKDQLQKNQLWSVLQNINVPVLGICIGMQLMAEQLMEGPCTGLGLIPAPVDRFPLRETYPVPHMGWNQIKVIKKNPLLENLDGDWFYFTHSYRLPLIDESLAQTNYGEEFSSVVQKDNWFGVQFHPEKSAEAGERLLKNFLQTNFLRN